MSQVQNRNNSEKNQKILDLNTVLKLTKINVVVFFRINKNRSMDGDGNENIVVETEDKF